MGPMVRFVVVQQDSFRWIVVLLAVLLLLMLSWMYDQYKLSYSAEDSAMLCLKEPLKGSGSPVVRSGSQPASSQDSLVGTGRHSISFYSNTPPRPSRLTGGEGAAGSALLGCDTDLPILLPTRTNVVR